MLAIGFLQLEEVSVATPSLLRFGTLLLNTSVTCANFIQFTIYGYDIISVILVVIISLSIPFVCLNDTVLEEGSDISGSRKEEQMGSAALSPNSNQNTN